MIGDQNVEQWKQWSMLSKFAATTDEMEYME